MAPVAVTVCYIWSDASWKPPFSNSIVWLIYTTCDIFKMESNIQRNLSPTNEEILDKLNEKGDNGAIEFISTNYYQDQQPPKKT